MDIISIRNAIVTSDAQYGPAHVLVAGKTATDKKLHAVAQAGFASKMYLAGKAGKVGKVARADMSDDSEQLIVAASIRANYKELATTLAGITGESVIISTRATFAAMPDVYAAKIADLRNEGYSVSKKDGTLVPTAKRKAYEECLALCTRVIRATAAHFAEAKRLKEEADAKAQQPDAQ